jgi:hypothetical protein
VQCHYILKLIERWRRNEFDAIEPTDVAVQRFGDYMKAGMGRTVWVGGCHSWYLDSSGDPILWPYTWQQWAREMEEPCMEDFQIYRFGDNSDRPSPRRNKTPATEAA